MTAVAFGDLLFGDLLSENNLRPWWEKYRGYFTGGALFSAVSLVYFTLTSELHLNCLPWGKNNTEVVTFSAIQAAAINSYCGRQLPWYINYIGAIEFGVAVFVLLVSSLWLNHPDVVDSFRTFAEVDRIISELNTPLQELSDNIVQPMAKDAKDEHKKLREAIMLIWNHDCAIDVQKVYVYRSKLLFALLIATGSASMWISILLWTASDKISCAVPERDRLDLIPNLEIYVCISRNIGFKLGLFSFSFCLSQLGQALVLLIGLFFVGKLKKPRSKAKKVEKNSIFMILFWRHGNPSRSGRLRDFLEFSFSKKARKIMGRNLEKALLIGDADFIEQYSKLNDGIDMVQILCDVIKKKETIYGQEEEYVIQEVRRSKFELDDAKVIVEAAARRKRWRMLTATLNSCNDNENYHVSWMKELDLNFDELTCTPHLTPWDEEAGSLLFHAISSESDVKKSRFLALKLLLCNDEDGRLNYVHFHGKSMTLRSFLKSDTGLKVCDDLETSLQLSSHESESSRSQTEIHKLFTELKDVGRNPTPGYLDALRNDIYRYKFSHWDDTIKEFAKHLYENSMWVELITLLNAFIVTEERRLLVGKLDCGVTKFDSVEEVFPIALLSQPIGSGRGYFVPTVALHILACCTLSQKLSCLKYIHDPQYQLSRLDKDILVNFIRERDHERQINNFSRNIQRKVNDKSNVLTDRKSTQEKLLDLVEKDARKTANGVQNSFRSAGERRGIPTNRCTQESSINPQKEKKSLEKQATEANNIGVTIDMDDGESVETEFLIPTSQ